MAHITNIGAGIYSELAYTATEVATVPVDQSAYEALTYVDVGNINTFPAVGNPANLTSIPQFGQSAASQIQGQIDSALLEFTVNWVGADHVDLQLLVGDQVDRGFRIRIANDVLPTTVLATTEHDDFYVVGSVSAFTVTPGLQGNVGTLTIAYTSDQVGPFTTV